MPNADYRMQEKGRGKPRPWSNPAGRKLLSGLRCVHDLKLLGIHLLVADPDLGTIVAFGPGLRVPRGEGQVLLSGSDVLLLFGDDSVARAIPDHLDRGARWGVAGFDGDV